LNTPIHKAGEAVPDDLSAIKAGRRATARVRRAGLLPRRADAAKVVADRGVPELTAGLPASAVITGYWPTDDEFDVCPLLLRLGADGHQIALPVVVAPGLPLIFRQWRRGDRLEAGFMGICAPLPGAPELDPDLVLVPFLEADRRGLRLGYGGGYYDRTLTRLRHLGQVVAIGVGFAGQIVDEVPHDDLDARLDAVLTEDGLTKTGTEDAKVST